MRLIDVLKHVEDPVDPFRHYWGCYKGMVFRRRDDNNEEHRFESNADALYYVTERARYRDATAQQAISQVSEAVLNQDQKQRETPKSTADRLRKLRFMPSSLGAKVTVYVGNQVHGDCVLHDVFDDGIEILDDSGVPTLIPFSGISAIRVLDHTE